MASATKDMTHGSPIKLILGFFFPFMFGLFFQQLYNMTDTMVVGRVLGVEALAGVGSTGSITFLIIGFCVGAANGFAIPVAQKFGEGDRKGMRKYVTNGIMVSAVLSVALAVVMCLLCGQMLTWMNTPADIRQNAYDYLFVMMLGIPVVFMYNMLFSVIRSMGDSRTPVMYLVFCSVLNVLLDLAFILWLDMGVAGAAWATLTAQSLSLLLCVNYILKCEELAFAPGDWKPDLACIGKLLGTGLPMGLQCSITAVGSIILQMSVNALGAVYVAAVTAGNKVSQLFICPFDALASTMTTYGGQNMGARKLDRIRKGYRSCLLIGLAYSAVATLVMWLFGDKLPLMFVESQNAEVIRHSMWFLRINGLAFWVLALLLITRLLIQGLGYTKYAMAAGGVEMVARTFTGAVLVPAMGYTAVCIASPLAWVAAVLLLVPTYLGIMRRLSVQMSIPYAQ